MGQMNHQPGYTPQQLPYNSPSPTNPQQGLNFINNLLGTALSGGSPTAPVPVTTPTMTAAAPFPAPVSSPVAPVSSFGVAGVPAIAPTVTPVTNSVPVSTPDKTSPSDPSSGLSSASTKSSKFKFLRKKSRGLIKFAGGLVSSVIDSDGDED